MNMIAGVPARLSRNETAPRPGGGGRMKTSLSGALPALVCAAVLALPSGEAGAQTPTDPRNQCGALVSGAATCSDRAYAGGIRYDESDGWNGGVAGAVTLIVTGGAATTVTAPATPPNLWTDSAIAVRTVAQGVGSSLSRAIALTVGEGANAVAIREGASTTSDGVYIHQDGRAADGATVTLGSGVTMGTSDDPMAEYGVQLLVIQGANSGVHSIDSAATIHSADWGLLMDARGSGNTMVTNSGSITTSEIGGTAGRKSGIRVLDWSGNRGVNRTADTTTTVTNSGSITVRAANAHGIHVDADGRGLYKIDHGVAGEDGTVAGTIAASGADGHGIYVNAISHEGVADANAVEIASRGDITASGPNGRGIYVRGRTAGVLSIEASAGTIRARSDTGEGDAGIWVTNSRAGAIIVDNSATIAASTYGILAIHTDNSANDTDDTDSPADAIRITHSTSAITSARGIGISAVIGANAPSRNSNNVKVNVTGGTVTASPTRNRVAIAARTWGTGSVNVNVGRGAALTSENNVGVFAVIENNPKNRTGGIAINQAGTISGRGGVYALVTPHVTGATRANQRVVDVMWTGTFTQADRGADVVQANNLGHALEIDHETTAKELFRVGGRAGIQAEVMSWRTASHHVSKADQPIIDNDAAADAILDSTSGDMADLKRKILGEIREALTNTGYTIAGVDTTGVDIGDDNQLAMWLKGRSDRVTVMKQALRWAFTEQERAVLEALADGNDANLATALNDLQVAVGTLPTEYRDRVMEIAGYHNDGNIRIAVNAPSGMSGMNITERIVSATDGVRAIFAFADDNNGSIEVTVGQGAEITGGRAGIYVANAGIGSDGVRKQHVKVHGTVTGGTDSAVHLAGGGKLTVGRMGRVLAGSSGKAVLVNDPGRAEIDVHGLVRGGPGAPAAVHLTGGGTVTVGLTGRIHANGAEHAIRGDDATVVVVPTETRRAGLTPETALAAIRERVDGTIGAGEGARVLARFEEIVDGVTSGHSRTVPVGEDGMAAVDTLGKKEEPQEPPPPPPPPGTPTMMPEEEPQEPTPAPEAPKPPDPIPTATPPVDAFDCNKAMDGRCSLYEALPSVLLAMNALPARDARLSATRDANGGWALVEGASSEWKAASATRPGGVAYDLRGHGVRAGVELAAGERLRVGVSAHHLRGNAKMSPVGEIELSGAGAGVNAAFAEDGFYADAQAAVTWFDAKLSSATHGVLSRQSDANGVGYALGLEAGKRIDVSRALSVTPRAGLEWSDASMSSFVFIDRVGSGVRVSVDEAQALTGRVGARVEAAPSGDDGVLLFGALDVSHLLSQGAGARVADTALKTTSEETGLRAGLGASWSGDEGFSLQGTAHYAASGGDNSGFGGSLSLAMRF